jgi:hypothetical protein
MAEIVIGGKAYDMKFTYSSLLAIEEYYGKGISKVFETEDLESLRTLTAFIYACLKRHGDFKHLTFDDLIEKLDETLEDGAVTLEELAALVKGAFDKSNTLQKATKGATTGKKK